MNSESSFDVLKHDLSRFLPLRIVLRPVAGYTGLCENSFSMDMSATHVRIWWSGKAYSFLGEVTLDGIEGASIHAKAGDLIFDPLADDCPVEIDWAVWRTAETKYTSRNAPFKLKKTQEE